MKAEKMRVIVPALAAVAALAAVSAQAAPVPSIKAPAAELGAAPPIELVAQGCGPGWHRQHWRDYWGRWHWGRCVKPLVFEAVQRMPDMISDMPA